MRFQAFLPVLPLLLAAPLYACSGGGSDPAPGAPISGPTDERCAQILAQANAPEEVEPSIRRMGSEEELDAYITRIEARNAEIQACTPSTGGGQDAGAGASPTSAPEPSNENVTNNQEAGVDEGGIVKNIGNSLVVLRQGRLYVTDVTDGRAPTLTDAIAVARDQSLNGGVWYDEMLVKGDLVYVVGYRYGVPTPAGAEPIRGATEIDSFRLVNGKLVRIATMFLESNDYYSGHNYASRMVDGKLAFYMPHYLGHGSNKKLAYPRVLRANDDGKFEVVGPIFGALDVFTSLTKPNAPTFHTVVQCALPADGSLDCHGRSVIGSWWRETYVSPSAVYLWASRHVYRFDLGALDVTTHTADGAPRDQFSFRESNGKLHVAVTTTPEPSARNVSASLLSLPLEAFDKQGKQAQRGVKFGEGYLQENRFVADVLVAAVGNDLVSVDTTNGKVTTAAGVTGVARLEPMGDRRVFVATQTAGALTLSARSVDALASPLSTFALPGAGQGEGRSHGFFYKPGEAGAGTIGYAIVTPNTGGSPNGYGNGISNLGFFDVSSAGAMTKLGVVSAGNVGTECETSCVDWYGNTRPIFLRQRAFALMGSELAEVTVRPEAKRLGEPVVLKK